MYTMKEKNWGNSFAVHWLGLCTFTDEGEGSIPGQGTKIPQDTRHGQKKKKKKKIFKKKRKNWNSFHMMYGK